jgi:hypothetical protein
MPRKTLKGGKRKNINSRRKRAKRLSLNQKQQQNRKVLIVNNGQMTTTTTNGNKTEQIDFNWNGQYDGKKATIDAKISGNGKTEEFHKTLNKNDIRDLFVVPQKNDMLENRLLNDWPTSSDILFPNEPMETRKFTVII